MKLICEKLMMLVIINKKIESNSQCHRLLPPWFRDSLGFGGDNLNKSPFMP